MPINFDDLDTDINARKPVGISAEDAVKRASIVNGGEAGFEQITCRKCGGRGSRTYGYVNFTTYPCGICKGTGKVTAKRLENIARAIKSEETRNQNAREARMIFQQAHGELLNGLSKASEWSPFASSLMESFAQYGKLSEKQIAAGESMLAKIAANKAAKAAEKNANAPVVEVSAIEALFATATGNGLKRPKFRATDGVTISLAPATGRNAGALYVKENGEYAGKIVGGRYLATREASAKVLPRLLAVAADPMGEAVLYGQQTGTCGCCGAELTNKLSIELGIGPICRGKWGI